MLRCILALLLTAGAAFGAERRIVVPEGGPPPVGPYSPGILVGDYLYVSGQGAVAPGGTKLETFEQQVRQCLENVKAIVVEAGLTMEHIVYAQVYLTDMTGAEIVDRVWRDYFPTDAPARAVSGITRIPGDNPIEITVVAVRDLAEKKVVELPNGEGRAVLTGDRLYLGAVHGCDLSTGRPPDDPAMEVETALRRAAEVLAAADLSLAHMVFVNPYLTAGMSWEEMNRVYARHFEFGDTPARATIRMAALPQDARFVITGVAVRDLDQRRSVRPRNMKPSPTASPCVLAGDTLFCSAKSGFIPGPKSGIWAPTVELQVRQSMRNLLDGLEEAGMGLSNIVASNVYLDTLEEFTAMNRVYGSYFESAPPTRTTLQPLPSVERRQHDGGEWPMLVQISVIAVR